MTCYEATNIIDRANFKGKVNTIFMPVFNKDTEYFSSIINSFARDINSFIIQSNVNGYGDSRITAPYNSYYKDIAKLKGGINHYYVIGELNFILKSQKKAYETKLAIAQKDIYNCKYFDNINIIKKNEENSYKDFIKKNKNYFT